MSLILIFIFCLGAIIGSFLNVVVLRFNTGRSFVSGRSGCFSCGKYIAWYENIPLISFLMLRGRCSACNSKISWQYPLVEFCTAVLFLLGFLKFQYLLGISLFSFLFSLVFFISLACFLILIFVYDFRHKIIPNEFVYPFILLSGLSLFFANGYYSFPSYLDLLAGPLLFLPFLILWLISSGRWIGFADGKLAWGIGFMLGLVHGISAIILGFWIGAGWAIFVLISQKIGLLSPSKSVTMKSEIPFGPFLIIGLIIVFFFPLDFFSLESLLAYYAIGF